MSRSLRCGHPARRLSVDARAAARRTIASDIPLSNWRRARCTTPRDQERGPAAKRFAATARILICSRLHDDVARPGVDLKIKVLGVAESGPMVGGYEIGTDLEALGKQAPKTLDLSDPTN